jgi:hypothetical protein
VKKRKVLEEQPTCSEPAHPSGDITHISNTMPSQVPPNPSPRNQMLPSTLNGADPVQDSEPDAAMDLDDNETESEPEPELAYVYARPVMPTVDPGEDRPLEEMVRSSSSIN